MLVVYKKSHSDQNGKKFYRGSGRLEFQSKQKWQADMFNVVMGFIWQTSLVALPIILVIQDTKYVVVDLIVVVYGKFDYEELA